MSEKGKTEKELLIEINEKLTKLLAVLAIQGKEQDNQIRILKKAGFNSEETGLYLGIPDATVRGKKAWKEKT